MVEFEPRGRVAVLRLDRAAKKNALTPAMLRDLESRVGTCSSARAIVLSGAGDLFCAGFDLSLAREDAGALGELIRALSGAARALRGAACPVVASAHGAAIAGGCALLCACDFVVADVGAKIGYPALRLGISPGVSSVHLASEVGAGAARRLQLDPGLIDGVEAHRLGLVSHLVPTPGACEARAIALATELAEKPAHAMARTKAWMNRVDASAEPDALDDALRASLAGVGGAEQVALLAAVWNKGQGPAEKS